MTILKFLMTRQIASNPSSGGVGGDSERKNEPVGKGEWGRRMLPQHKVRDWSNAQVTDSFSGV